MRRSHLLMHMTALAAGGVFGLGLGVSGMIDPAKVLNFLDLAGHWDPTLALVMGGALAVAFPAFQLALHGHHQPLCGATFDLPTRTAIDWRLIGGATIFGIGWGLAGFCPGPAIAALASGSWPVAGFVATMLIGQWLADRVPVAGSSAAVRRRSAPKSLRSAVRPQLQVHRGSSTR